MRRAFILSSLCIIPAALASPANLPAQLQGVGIEQHLDTQLPLDTEFTDESGRHVSLRTFFHGKPVLFAPVYFTCPMLCSQILRGVVAGLRPLSLQPGRDFGIVAMSINPSDPIESARNKRNQYSQSLSSRNGTAGWHFLIGSQASIDRVTKAIGFRYHWDYVHKMFVHASGIMLITPEGRLARYFYGVEYEPKDLKLGLIEASNNRIGSPVDQILLFCYHYDPATGKYGATVINLLRGVAALVLASLIAMLVFFWRREARIKHASLGATGYR